MSKTVTPLSPQELIRLLTAARAHSVRDWAMFLTGYLHAMRASEIGNLRLADVDIQTGHIRIARLKGSLMTVQAIEKHRGIPILDEQKALREWLAIRPTDCGDAPFTGKKSGRLSRSQIFRLFQQYATEIGLPEGRRHVHLLKHSLCSHLVRQGVHLARVQIAAGHRSISSTMKYTHLTDGDADVSRQAALMSMDWARGAAAGSEL
jgi:integrase